MLTPEQKSRLSPEQLIISERWEIEKAERSLIIDELDRAMKHDEIDAYKIALEKLKPTTQFCEHDRDIFSSCGACDEIEQLLNPELYCKKCEERAYDPFGGSEGLDKNGLCEYCRE